MPAKRPARLQQTTDGKWFKLGAGHPVAATNEELEIWQSARDDILQQIGTPKSRWTHAMDLLKQGTVMLAILAFMTLMVEWMLISAEYSALGARVLAFHAFAQNPVHSAGVEYLVTATSFTAGGIGLGWLFAERYLARAISNQRPIALLLLYVMLILVAYSLGIGSEIITDANPMGPFYSFALGAAFLSSAGFAVVKADWKQDGLKTLAKGLLALGVLLFLLYFLFIIPDQLGKARARAVLEGSHAYPGAVILLKEEHPVSDLVTSQKKQNGQWLYQADVLTGQKGKDPVYSLQYLGESENAVYLWDFGIDGVHMISRDSVLEVLLLH